MDFGKGYFKTYEEGIQREWVVTNGLGSYAGSSIIGANTRKHHGLLIASLHPPVQRHLVLSQIRDTLTIEGELFNLSTAKRPMWVERGFDFLQRFRYDLYPTYTYQVRGIFIEKSIVLERGKNTVALRYDIKNGSQASTLCMTPLYNDRDHNHRRERAELRFTGKLLPQGYTLTPLGSPSLTIKTLSADTEFSLRQELYDEDMMYDTEIATGNTAIDNHYTPIDLSLTLEPYESKRIYIICSIEDTPNSDGEAIFRDYETYYKGLQDQADMPEDFLRQLVHASDQFIVHRQSTGLRTVLAGLPWFSDWGRDTMIALQGLTLCTKRYQDNQDILKTFAAYVKKGLVPNLFPDEGTDPMYNTVDAAMWYFHAVDRYLHYTGSETDYTFVKVHIYPKMKEIIEAYKTGTDFSIHMDKDGLIHAGSGFDQVTWMDVRVGEWVVTPRHGKPVEINALWYNALCIMAQLSARYGEDPEPYRQLAAMVKSNFCLKFWNEEASCLYDVVDDKDPSVRPNQIWAVSLPHTMLSEEQNLAVVNKVINDLYATYGLRSLSPRDPAYKGSYKGKLQDRDAAYHQGTAWAFPLGGLITAYVKVHNHSPEAIRYAELLLAPMKDHLRDGCVGTIAEIFDGDSPNLSRGCYAQAWSVGEVLRAYYEDILPYR